MPAPALTRTGLPLSSLREISLLKMARHENVVRLLHVATGRSLSSVFLVMEFCEVCIVRAAQRRSRLCSKTWAIYSTPCPCHSRCA